MSKGGVCLMLVKRYQEFMSSFSFRHELYSQYISRHSRRYKGRALLAFPYDLSAAAAEMPQWRGLLANVATGSARPWEMSFSPEHRDMPPHIERGL